jgi:hypothetical protein
MKFIIRDDDLNYFSTPEDIKVWYIDIFEQDIPVSFAMIPFVKPSSDVYPFYPVTKSTPKNIEDKEYPIHENAGLVKYVANNSLINVLQHGCNHETKQGVFEYAQQIDLREDTVRGRKELELAFGKTVNSFAAPHDWINTTGVHGIEAARLNIIRGRGVGFRNWMFRIQYLGIFLLMLVYRFPRYISHNPKVYPYLLDFGRHKELCSYRLEDEDVFEGLSYAHKKKGIFVVVVHVHTLTNEKKTYCSIHR